MLCRGRERQWQNQSIRPRKLNLASSGDGNEKAASEARMPTRKTSIYREWMQTLWRTDVEWPHALAQDRRPGSERHPHATTEVARLQVQKF